MKSFKFTPAALLLIVFSCIAAFAQIAQPTATPVQTSGQSENEDDDVVRISTNLIQVDVVVTDKNGNVIRDLKPEDFEIHENDEVRQISGFSFVSPTEAQGKINENISLAASNSSRVKNETPSVGEAGRIVAIVIDDARMSVDSINYTKKALTDFIQKEILPGDLVGIFKTSGSIGVLQRFTTDKQQLLKVVSELKFQAATAESMFALAPTGISFSQQVMANLDGLGGQAQAMAESRPDIEKMSDSYRNQFIAVGAMKNLQRTIEAMGNLRGRKALVLVSQGINLRYIDEDGSGGIGDLRENGTASSQRIGRDGETAQLPQQNQIKLASPTSIIAAGKNFPITDIVKYITEIANRNSVSIFSVDPRGAVTTNLSAADSTRGGMFNSMSRDQINQVTVGRNDQVRYSQETLKKLAEETGGKAFINSNDISGGLREALNSQRGYYLLAYQPDEETFDAKSFGEFQKSGIANNFDFNAPRAGVYKIKVLIRDAATKKIGTAGQSIFVPNLSKDEISLSGLLLQNFTAAEWQTLQTNAAEGANLISKKTPNDTSLRRFKKGTILSFIYSVYASPDLTKGGARKLSATTKLLKDGQAILSGKPEEFSFESGKNSVQLNRRGAIALGANMAAGKYSLELNVTVAGSEKSETQIIDFEIIH